MAQKSFTGNKLEIVIHYLNYNGPLFFRNSTKYDSAHQKEISSIRATIGT